MRQQRKQNNNRKKSKCLKFLLYIIIILLCAGIIAFCIEKIKEYKIEKNRIIKEKQKIEAKIKENEEKKRIAEEEANKEKKISLIAGGDALIHDTVYNSARIGKSFDFKPKFEYIKQIVKNYDLAYYNQETILSGDEIPLSNYPCFSTPTQVGDAYIDAGFNLVSLATNHIMDKGSKGVEASSRYWNKQKDKILYSGSASSKEEAERVDIREKNGIKYTMISYRMPELSNGLPHTYDYEVNEYTFKKAKADISKVRDKVDVLIVSMHWGVEDADYRTEYQRKTAEELSSLGVDIILGTHSHVIQPIERINNTIVVYSLGNFISDQIPIKNLIGTLISMDITVKNKKVKVDNIGARLMYTNKRNGYKVTPWEYLDKSILPQKDQMHEYFKNVLTSLSDEVKILN